MTQLLMASGISEPIPGPAGWQGVDERNLPMKPDGGNATTSVQTMKASQKCGGSGNDLADHFLFIVVQRR